MVEKNKMTKIKKGIFARAFSGFKMPSMKGEAEDDLMQEILNRLEDLEAMVGDVGGNIYPPEVEIGPAGPAGPPGTGGAGDWDWHPGPGILFYDPYIHAHPDTDYGMTWGALDSYASRPFRIADGDGLYINPNYRRGLGLANINGKDSDGYPIEIYFASDQNPVVNAGLAFDDTDAQGERGLKIKTGSGIALSHSTNYQNSVTADGDDSVVVRLVNEDTTKFPCGLQYDPRKNTGEGEVGPPTGQRGLMAQVYQRGGLMISTDEGQSQKMQTSGIRIAKGKGLGVMNNEVDDKADWSYQATVDVLDPMWFQTEVMLRTAGALEFSGIKTDDEGDEREAIGVNVGNGLGIESSVNPQGIINVTLGPWEAVTDGLGLGFNTDTHLTLYPADFLYIEV